MPHANGMLTRVDSLIAPGLEAAGPIEYMSSRWVAPKPSNTQEALNDAFPVCED